jgi:hypothetical protein
MIKFLVGLLIGSTAVAYGQTPAVMQNYILSLASGVTPRGITKGPIIVDDGGHVICSKETAQ